MSTELKLLAPLGYPKSNAIQLVAQVSNVPLQFQELSYKNFQAPEFQQKSPLGTFPVLETSTGNISDTNAILRYLARVSPQTQLYGNSHFETAQIDSYLDLANLELQPASFALTAPVYGWLQFNQARYEQAKLDLHKLFKILNEALLLKTYFVGTQLTLADVVIFTTLVPLFKFILDEEIRKQYSNITRWFNNLAAQPIFVKYFGKAFLAKKEWTFDGQQQFSGVQEQQAVQQPAKSEKKEAAPKKQQKKEAAPKKEAAKKEAAPKKEAEPKKAEPVSSFNLFDYKTQITNATYRAQSVQFLFDNLDRENFSVHYMEYEKYEGEGIKLFLTSNLKDSNLQRLDHFRKNAYAVHGVYGDEGNYDLFGVWLWKGKGHPQEIKDLPNYEYHKFRELDLSNEADRKLIMDSWTGLEEGKSVVNGKIARDITQFK